MLPPDDELEAPVGETTDPSSTEFDEDVEGEAPDDEDDDYGPPFEARSFGGEFVWAQSSAFTCKILRVKPGEVVIVSTRGRRDMHAMLTGGRAMLEIHEGPSSDQVELMPASPIRIEPGRDYRLVAITEVELFTVYAPLSE